MVYAISPLSVYYMYCGKLPEMFRVQIAFTVGSN